MSSGALRNALLAHRRQQARQKFHVFTIIKRERGNPYKQKFICIRMPFAYKFDHVKKKKLLRVS